MVAFYLAVLAAGLGGYRVLLMLGLEDREAWAGGRMAGLVAVAFPAWWTSVAGLGGWRWVGAALLAAGAVLGGRALVARRGAWKQIAAAEAVFVVCFVAVLLLRLDRPEIRGTEKPMDLGILASLLRARSFPPPDMWLAGEVLPYYYWGALLWTVPLWVSRIPLEVGYNLIVALLAGLAGSLAWATASRWSGPWRGALLSTFFMVLAGTPDGLRQVLSGTALRSLDYWHSSRQVADAITEFPLFTFWLGDLHPHLLALPLTLLAVLLALTAGREGPRSALLAAVAVVSGVTWAANPWAMPPTLAAVGLMLVAGDGRWRWPWGPGWRRWAGAAAVAVGGWVATAPFHLSFHPPFQGIGLVHAWTTPAELVLFAGPLMVAAAVGVVGIAVAWGGGHPERRLAAGTVVVAVAVLAAAVSGRPVASFLAVVALVLAVYGVTGAREADRPALLLAALGIFLFLVPEILFVRDPYGEKLHRMNTIFKAWFQGWMFLALALPTLLRRGVRRPGVRLAVAVFLVLPALPHLAGMATGPLLGRQPGLDGLRWMSPGDRAAVRFLRRQPPGTALVEAVGGAYSDYARLSAASGVPALLGWGNHELVWRGPSILPELERRRKLVKTIYGSGDPAEVARAVAEAGVDLVAVGTFEKKDGDLEKLAAVAEAGERVFEASGTSLYRFPEVGSR